MKRIFIAFIVALVCIVGIVGCDDTSTSPSNNLNFEQVYASVIEAGCTGTLEELADAFKSDKAYHIAVKNGYKGSDAAWLASLIVASEQSGTSGITPHINNGYCYIRSTNTGVKAIGENGKSAYEIAAENDYSGTKFSWLSSVIDSSRSNTISPH